MWTSGGTAFKVRAMSLEGQVLAEYEGIPCRHYQLGEEETIRRINLNMDAILALFDGRREDCLAHRGRRVSGIDSPEDEEIVLRIYKALPGFFLPHHLPERRRNDPLCGGPAAWARW